MTVLNAVRELIGHVEVLSGVLAHSVSRQLDRGGYRLDESDVLKEGNGVSVHPQSVVLVTVRQPQELYTSRIEGLSQTLGRTTLLQT